MSRAKPERWEETERHHIGFTTGYGRGKTLPWFAVLYRVIEVRKEGGRAVAIRERTRHGKTLNGLEVPEMALHALLAIVADVADVLSHYAAERDRHATSKRKAR